MLKEKKWKQSLKKAEKEKKNIDPLEDDKNLAKGSPLFSNGFGGVR